MRSLRVRRGERSVSHRLHLRCEVRGGVLRLTRRQVSSAQEPGRRVRSAEYRGELQGSRLPGVLEWLLRRRLLLRQASQRFVRTVRSRAQAVRRRQRPVRTNQGRHRPSERVPTVWPPVRGRRHVQRDRRVPLDDALWRLLRSRHVPRPGHGCEGRALRRRGPLRNERRRRRVRAVSLHQRRMHDHLCKHRGLRSQRLVQRWQVRGAARERQELLEQGAVCQQRVRRRRVLQCRLHWAVRGVRRARRRRDVRAGERGPSQRAAGLCARHRSEPLLGCTLPAPVPCGSYACGATECKTTYEGDGDCARGNLCDRVTSKCVSGATCDGDHIVTGASSTPQDCTPYKCEASGVCRSTCNSVADCVAPTFCDPLGKCVAPSEASSGAGCAIGVAGGGHAPWWALLGVASLAVRRRTGRRSAACSLRP